MTDWREAGEVIRERWRNCLSEYARALAEAERPYKYLDGSDFDPRDYLIEFPFNWLEGGFPIGYDPSRFSPERKRVHAAEMIKQKYWDLDDLNGRPRGEGLRVAATTS